MDRAASKFQYRAQWHCWHKHFQGLRPCHTCCPYACWCSAACCCWRISAKSNSLTAPMSNHYFGLTDLGRVRDNNEDAFLVEPVKGSERVLAAVIDGVGGYEGGEVAASIARDCIAALLDRPISDVSLALRTA